MASAVVETFLGITGLTVTVDLYPLGSDTAGATGITMTEATNRKGLYTGTTTAALTGEHQAFIKSGSTVVGLGYVWMTDDTAVHRIVDNAAVDAKSGTSMNLGSWLGTVVATPATAGIPDVNAKNVNNVATTSVTTVSANLGTTQPVNFTGTGGSALVKGDAIDLAGQTITAAAGVTFPSSVASPTNITAGTITTATNLTTNNDKTGYGLAAADVPLKKNTALNNYEFVMVASSDGRTPTTGLTVTAQRSLDGGAFASCANAVSEVSVGVYKINLATTDTNADTVTFRFTATGADATLITHLTQ